MAGVEEGGLPSQDPRVKVGDKVRTFAMAAVCDGGPEPIVCDGR